VRCQRIREVVGRGSARDHAGDGVVVVVYGGQRAPHQREPPREIGLAEEPSAQVVDRVVEGGAVRRGVLHDGLGNGEHLPGPARETCGREREREHQRRDDGDVLGRPKPAALPNDRSGDRDHDDRTQRDQGRPIGGHGGEGRGDR
jgi:hypothetical protein